VAAYFKLENTSGIDQKYWSKSKTRSLIFAKTKFYFVLQLLSE